TRGTTVRPRQPGVVRSRGVCRGRDEHAHHRRLYRIRLDGPPPLTHASRPENHRPHFFARRDERTGADLGCRTGDHLPIKKYRRDSEDRREDLAAGWAGRNRRDRGDYGGKTFGPGPVEVRYT